MRKIRLNRSERKLWRATQKILLEKFDGGNHIDPSNEHPTMGTVIREEKSKLYYKHQAAINFRWQYSNFGVRLVRILNKLNI